MENLKRRRKFNRAIISSYAAGLTSMVYSCWNVSKISDLIGPSIKNFSQIPGDAKSKALGYGLLAAGTFALGVTLVIGGQKFEEEKEKIPKYDYNHPVYKNRKSGCEVYDETKEKKLYQYGAEKYIKDRIKTTEPNLYKPRKPEQKEKDKYLINNEDYRQLKVETIRAKEYRNR